MPSIEEYRNTFPELKGLDDVDVIRKVAKAYDVPIEAVTTHMGYEPKGGDFWRQFKNSGTQTEQLLAGAGAAAAATAESAFGPGGLATAAKNAALEKYKSIGEELQINSKASDSATTAYDMARNGDPGALVDFLQGAIGMGLGQIGQSVLTAGAGGLLGKAALKGTVERVAGGMVAKETAALMEAGEVSKDVAEKIAVSNVANRVGQNLAITGQVLQQEGGEIGGDLTQKATDEGRVLTGAEVFRALAATAAAAGPEALTDRAVLDALSGKLPWLKSLPEATTIGGKVGRAAISGSVGAGIGGAQEVAQTYTEELGKGNPIDEKAHRSAIDAGVMGIIAEAMPGAVGGYIHGPDITREKDQSATQENAEKSPNQVTVEQVNQLRDARLRQLDEEERGVEGGLYRKADGSTELRVGKMGRQLTPQEMGERLFLTRNPNPAIVAKRFGLILTPDSADTVASDIAKTEIPSVSSGQKPFDGVDEIASVAGQVTAFEQAAKQTPSVPIPEGIHPEQRTPSSQTIYPVDEQLSQETGIPPIQPAAIQQADNGLDVGADISDQPAQEQAQIPVEKTAMEIAFEKARNKTNIPEQAARVSPEETSTLALVDQPISQIPDQPGQVALQKSEAQAQLPTQEAQQAVKTSEIPGVKSRQALEQDTGKQATTVINLDGLKAISDTYGQEAETKAIKALTESAKAAGLDVYHVEGNNFAVLSANAIKAKRDVAALKAQADQVQVDLGDHVMNGIPISHGTARSLPEAVAKSQQEQITPNITQKPIPSAREVMDKANEEPDTGVLPKGLTDRRFLKESYRSAVQSLSNSLVPGGGIAHIKDEHDRIIGRTSSVNPMWFQDFKEVFPSVKAVDKAVKKALEGKTLGKSQARIITGLMNAYDSEIADNIQEYGNPNDYRVMYEEERDAMGDIGSTPGEFLIAKLYNKALDSGIPENEIVSVIGSHRDDYAGAITALEGMIDEAKSETENQYQENTNAYARQDQGSGQEAAWVREQEAFALTNEKDGEEAKKDKPDKSAEERRKADLERPHFGLSGGIMPDNATAKQNDIFSNQEGKYERKPNSVPSRESNSRPISKKATPVQGQFDLFAKPGESKRQAYADLYHVIVKAKPVATIRSAVDHISSPEDLGHLMASIRKDAQEAMYAVVTDNVGKILRVFRHTKGHKTSSSVSPLIIVSEAASIEGANTIHLVHNHPSGNPSPSKDDERVTEATARSAEGTGMSVGYHVVIGRSSWQEVGTSSQTKFVPIPRKHSIQITERTFVKNDPSGETIVSKDNLVKAFNGIDSGILLLNYQHQVAGVIMMSDAEMQALKSGGGEGAKRILAAIDKSNASAIALKTDSMPSAKNIGSFVSAIRGSGELRLLDWIDSKGASAAESGNIDALYNLGGVYTSQSEKQRGPTANSDKISSAISRTFGNKVLTKLGNRLVIPSTEAELRAEMKKRGSKFTDMMFSDEASKVSRFQTHNVKGFYDPSTDTSYMLPWNMKESEAPGVFLHEVGVHYGLEKMLGDKYSRVVGDTAKMVRMGSKSAMDAMRSVNAAEGLGFDPESKDFRNQMADKILSDKRIAQEAIAYIAEKNANLPLVKRIVSAIKEFLYRIGFTGKLDEGMLTTMAIRAARRGDASGIVVNGVDAMRSSRAPNWYSQMSRVLGNKLPAKGSVEQMKRVIEAFQRKGDFKAEELEYSGIIPWLDSQEGVVTRDDIIEQLALNAVQVRDVTLGRGHGYDYSTASEWQGAIDRAEKSGNFDEAERIQRAWEGLDETTGSTDGQPKFAEYQLPGGTNYREVLLTLPNTKADRLDARRKEIEAIGASATSEQKQEWASIMNQLRPNTNDVEGASRFGGMPDFRSPHFDQPNIVAHLRVNDRTDANGGRMLFVEEVQSDWAQSIRKKKNIIADVSGIDAIPDAPFKSTEAWSLLAMKAALRKAVEGGYDSIGWTDGETQALRYQDDNAETMMKRYKGMVKFYDEILPNTVNKFVKKWGGRVDKSSITTGPTVDEIRDGENKGAKVNRKIHIVPITDGMREEIPNGLPLFSSASHETERETPAQSLVGDKFTIPPLTRFQKVIRKLQDESVVFKAVQDAVEKQGGTITEATNMSEAIKRYPGRLAAAMKDTTDNLVEPFMKRIHDAGTTMDEVALLAYAEFAPIRNAEIAKINNRFPNNGEPGKSGSGMTDIEAAEIVKQAKEHPNSKNLFALAEELRSIPERNLENRVAGGVMTQEQADEYAAKSPKYIPLKGFELADERGVTVGTGQGLSTGSKLDFRALGRSSRAGQIFENTIRDYEIGLQLVEKANVARTIREFVKANPDKKLWDVDNAPEKPYLHKGGVVYQVWSGDRVIVELASQKDAKAIVDGLKATDPDARLEEVRPSPNVHMRETQFDPTEEIRFIEDGKPVRIQLFNEDMTRSYNRLWHSGVSDGLTILNNYNSWLRQFYTQKNPAWFVMNALKDVQSVIPYVTGEAGVKVAMKVPGNLRGAFKAAWAMHHGLKAEGGWDETIKQFMNSGGYTGFSYVGDIEAQTLRLNAAIARHTPWDEAAKKFKTEGIKKGVAAVGAKVLNTRFFSWIEAMNSTFENMTRLAVFKAGMDGGMTANEAGKLAKNASTNFNTRGEWGPNINAVWLFANAGIQGTRNVGHALLFSKHREQVWALMGGLAALGVMAGMMSDDDDDLLDDQLRSRYLAMKFGDSQVSIPMPYGFGFFAGFGQLVAQAIKHPEKQEQLAVKMASLAADHFSPFGNPLTDKLDMKNIVNIAPTFPKPFLNVAANVSPFGGAPLYPDSPFDTTRPDSEKMWTATRGSGYDVVAEWLNTLTGGDKVMEGAVSVSPETLKLSVSTMFGGAGKLMSDMLSIPFDAANETLSAKKMPIVKNFYREIDKDAYLQRFYEEAKDAQDAYTTFRNYQKQGMVDDATAYRNEEAAYVSMGRLVTTYRKQIKRLKDMETHINNSDAPVTEKNIGLAKTNKAIIETTSAFNDRLKSFN